MSEDRIRVINIEDEMKTAYIDYSMSVIVARALPDVRDGLKPVHRRVLYGMNELGLLHSKAHKKSARIVGEVLGKYHPHGDGAVYDSMVRMAQDWSLRYPLIDGQGNFGSMDGDSPAAMRYTEARLERLADYALADIKKDTVEFTPNFDDSLDEPSVLPTRVPMLLVNGASGIAVGMATNMLPHNLTEVCHGTIAMVKNPAITTEELMEYIKAPDFPTGGEIYGYKGVKEAYETGRGRVVVRGKAEIQSTGGRESIIITEIPYQVNKASLHQKIADLVNAEKIKGISDVRDESDRNGVRLVVEIKRDAMANVVLSKLYKYTPLQNSYGVNNIALVDGRPETLSLKKIVEEFIKFRIEVVVNRTKYELGKAEERAHILEGLIIAVDNIDQVIKIIRSSSTVADAKDRLMTELELSDLQAKAVLEMRLQKLVSLEIEKLKKEYEEIMTEIKRLKDILAHEHLQREIIIAEIEEVMERFGDERRTVINYSADGEISIEDMIPNDEVVVTISNLGYIKRTKSSEYKVQGRGGRGSRGSKTRETDFLEHMFIAENHNYLLLFTEQGRCFWVRIYELPEASKQSQGRVVQNILALPKEDKIKAYIVVKDLENQDFLKRHYVLFATKQGVVKKTSLEAYSRPRTNGIIAINIREDDQLLEAKLTNGNSLVMMVSRSGNAVTFDEQNVKPTGRSATGVRGMRLRGEDDFVVGANVFDKDENEKSILVLSENGYGKRTDVDQYSVIQRGGKGMKTMKVTDKTGFLIATKVAGDESDLMITTTTGIVIRLAVSDINVQRRDTQGVRAIKLSHNDRIADVALVDKEDSDEEE